jgi:hypothetical protein
MKFRTFLTEYMDQMSDGTKVAYDKEGLIPGLPNAFDATQTADYLKKGEHLLAALTIASIIPDVGSEIGWAGDIQQWVDKNFGGTASEFTNYTPNIEKVRHAIEKFDTSNPGMYGKMVDSIAREVKPVNIGKEHLKGALHSFVIKKFVNADVEEQDARQQAVLSEGVHNAVKRKVFNVED